MNIEYSEYYIEIEAVKKFSEHSVCVTYSSCIVFVYFYVDFILSIYSSIYLVWIIICCHHLIQPLLVQRNLPQ